MATIEMPHIDLECGHRSPAVAGGATTEQEEEEEEEEDELGRECRICYMSLVSCSPTSAASGVAIDLGCSCKNDLSAAHKHCAETWFKIKGNKTCEICNSVAHNVVGPNDMERAQAQEEEEEVNYDSNFGGSSDSASAADRGSWSWLNGHRFLNFLLACMVFAFVISWLFHFNLPS